MSKRFVCAAMLDGFEPGMARIVEIGGRSVCLARTEGGEWGAIDNICTHDGGTLGEGEVVGNAIECPRHGGRFDLRSGRVVALPPVRNVTAHTVRIVGNEIQVRIATEGGGSV
jgi:3-phenylpropionate/trans-cinnamate dioxygenase ferredoxin subunit